MYPSPSGITHLLSLSCSNNIFLTHRNRREKLYWWNIWTAWQNRGARLHLFFSLQDSKRPHQGISFDFPFLSLRLHLWAAHLSERKPTWWLFKEADHTHSHHWGVQVPQETIRFWFLSQTIGRYITETKLELYAGWCFLSHCPSKRLRKCKKPLPGCQPIASAQFPRLHFPDAIFSSAI